MDIKNEQSLQELEMYCCAWIDSEIRKHVQDYEEFEYYSPTSKKVKELADKFHLTLEEMDKLWNYYYDSFEKLTGKKLFNLK